MNLIADNALVFYAYARGYHDGRVNGYEDEAYKEHLEELHSAECQHAYRVGYDSGVSDYCYFDGLDDEMDREEDHLVHNKE